jgi:hypothetical protein
VWRSGHLLREALAKIVDQLSRVVLGRGDKDIGLNAGVGGVYELGVDDTDERHLRAQEARQLCPDISRMRRDRLVVDGNENLLKDHDSLLELRDRPKMHLISSGCQTSNHPLPTPCQPVPPLVMASSSQGFG